MTAGEESAVDFAALWAVADAGITYNEARASVQARELDDLAALGVDVSDPAALAAAYSDRYLMAQHGGRQMRATLALLPPERGVPRSHGLRLADMMRTARERLVPLNPT